MHNIYFCLLKRIGSLTKAISVKSIILAFCKIKLAYELPCLSFRWIPLLFQVFQGQINCHGSLNFLLEKGHQVT